MRSGDERDLGSGEPDALIGAPVGPFTIVRRIGEGGMARVYLAEHAVLHTRRAVKVLSPRLSHHALLVRRFVNEARAAARLHHRNLIEVHDVGQLACGAWFMVLDYLEGETLARFLASRAGSISPRAIAHVVGEVAAGLQVAHDHGIVHRDLKPENVFLVRRDGEAHRAVVLDFGVAQHGDDPDAGPGTPLGMAVGTPAYMAPEQLCGGRVSPAADTFALGVIAYRLTTGGWFPYQAAESHAGYSALPASALYHRQLTQHPIDPRDRGAAISATWASAILAAIALDPAARPPSAQAFALRLAEAVPLLAPESDGIAVGGPVRAEAGEGGARWAGSHYELGDKLGSGGMAEVFTGTMVGVEGFERRVAIKRVLAGLSQIPAFAAMFVAEAKIASRLAHPNVVSVLDFSRDAAGRLFLVMEYVDGKDLASLVETGPIPPRLALFITVELLRGLGHAHELSDPAGAPCGVIHRDVSPQNLLVSYEGAVKVSDFGLAKARAAGEGVQSATVRGKPRYMSPEQLSGAPLDGRADLYAVGVMLWEMLAHRPLYVGTANEIVAQVMFKPVPRAGTLRAGVPADLEAVAMTLMARDRDDRYPTAAAAIEALLACQDVPRDGRGELAHLLAERFRRGAELAPPVAAAPALAGAPPPLGAAIATNLDPPSVVLSATTPSLFALLQPRRGSLAAALSGLALGVVAAAVVVVGGRVAQSSTDARARRAVPVLATVTPRAIAAPVVAAEPRVGEAAPAQSAPSGAAIGSGSAGAHMQRALGPAGHEGRTSSSPASRDAGDAPARPRPSPPVRARRTGELAILVRPWALIWLDGKPSGQTPFRAAVPAGRYRVRLVNDELGKVETTTVVVEPDRDATVERSW